MTSNAAALPLGARDPVFGEGSPDLSSYAAKPYEERAALIETWMCGQLENEGFVTMVKDLELVWQRMLFGA